MHECNTRRSETIEDREPDLEDWLLALFPSLPTSSIGCVVDCNHVTDLHSGILFIHPEGTMLAFTPNFPVRLGSSFLFHKVLRRPVARHESYLRASAAPTAANVLLKQAASSNDLTLNQVDSFLQLSRLLLAENAKYNLTAIREPDDVIRKHIVDALTLLPTLKTENPSKLIDVGTGAGFPGLVLAIARPDLQFTLLDSVRKKTAFHDLVIRELGLYNVRSIWARAEVAGQDLNFREKFCVAMARSVAELRVLAELTLPFARIGGCVIAQKSVDEDQREIRSAAKSLKICGGVLESVECGWPRKWRDIEGSEETSEEKDDRRKAIVVVRKASVTPRKYPRKPGIPKKSPL